MYHISCQTTVILAVFEFSCLFSYMIQYLYIYIQRDRFLHVFLAQKYLCKNMYILNRFETNCGTSIIPFLAIWGLCWYIYRNLLQPFEASSLAEQGTTWFHAACHLRTTKNEINKQKKLNCSLENALAVNGVLCHGSSFILASTSHRLLLTAHPTWAESCQQKLHLIPNPNRPASGCSKFVVQKHDELKEFCTPASTSTFYHLFIPYNIASHFETPQYIDKGTLKTCLSPNL